MILFESLLVAVSTYSVVPVPQFDWNERNMKYAICFFPAVGVLCGALLWGWYALAGLLGVSSLLFAAVAVCIPLLVTGGIHMDGYMDTVDALASHQTKERKLEIMKDPNCGAFAVVYCGIYLLLSLGLMYELFDARCLLAICPMFILSRALSALCAVTMPSARKGGMLRAYTKDAAKRKTVVAMSIVAVLCAVGMILLSPIVGGIAVLFAALSMFLYRRMAMKQFGGVTGDTAGFFLQLCELCCMVGAWIGAMLV